MEKNFTKKVLAVFLSFALVLTTLTFSNYSKVSAEGVDWSDTSSWTSITLGGVEYKLQKEGFVNGFNTFYAYQNYMQVDALWCDFTSAEYTKVVINGTTYEAANHKVASSTVRFEGAQMWWSPNLCNEEQNTMIFYQNDVEKGRIYVYRPGGAVDPQPSEESTEAPVYKWVGWISSVGNANLSTEATGYTINYSIGNEWWNIQTWTNYQFEAGNKYVCSFKLTAPSPNKKFRVDENASGDPIIFNELVPQSWVDNGDGTYTYWYYGESDTNINGSKNVRIGLGYNVSGEGSEYTSGGTYKFTVSEFVIAKQSEYDGEVPEESTDVVTPSDVSATGGIESISASWTATDAPASQKYNIYIDDNVEPLATNIVGTSCNLTNVPAGVHTVYVEGITGGVKSEKVAASQQVTVIPKTPIGFVVIPNDLKTNYTFAWNESSTASATEIKLYINDVEWGTIARSGVVVTYVDLNVAVGNTYTFGLAQVVNGVTSGKATVDVTVEGDSSEETTSIQDEETTSIQDEETTSSQDEEETTSTTDEEETTVITEEEIPTSEADLSNVVTSDELCVEGFQIKTNNTVSGKVGFRTVCKVPNIGTTIVGSDGNSYKIKEMGIIYTRDYNTSGYRKDDIVGKKFTVLNPNTRRVSSTSGLTMYGGALNTSLTVGYVATEVGMIREWNVEDTEHTYYVQTIADMVSSNLMEKSMHVRAFIVAEDGTIVYGTKMATTSTPQVASHLYTQSLAPNVTAHNYLFTEILSNTTIIKATNPYYRNTMIEFGWNNSVTTPEPVTKITVGTLEDLNKNS